METAIKNTSVWEQVCGRERELIYTKAFGPRNLRTACEDGIAFQKENVWDYGNIGCGLVDMEVDGRHLSANDRLAFLFDVELYGLREAFAKVERYFRRAACPTKSTGGSIVIDGEEDGYSQPGIV